MELNDGQRLKLLADDLKKTKGITHRQFAEMVDITAEHLSHVFRKDRITDEIKENAIAAFDLPADYFSRKIPAPTNPQAPNYPEELENYRQLVIQLQAQVREWREKYEQVKDELFRLQTEYLEHLKKYK